MAEHGRAGDAGRAGRIVADGFLHTCQWECDGFDPRADCPFCLHEPWPDGAALDQLKPPPELDAIAQRRKVLAYQYPMRSVTMAKKSKGRGKGKGGY